MSQQVLDTDTLKKQCQDWIDQMHKILNSKDFKLKMKGKLTVVKLIKSKLRTIENQLNKNIL